MSLFHFIFFILVFLSACWFLILGSASSCCWFPQNNYNQPLNQKTDRFWDFHEESNTWVEVTLPYELITCVNNNCTKVGTINPITEHEKNEQNFERDFDSIESLKRKDGSQMVLPIRKRVSLTKMSDTSIWITGASGSIYERFWNGLQWVIAPHDLPLSAGYAICVFIVNQTILALSESGVLYQMQINESSQPIWVEFRPNVDEGIKKEMEKGSMILIKSGLVSHDGVRIYFCTRNGSLLELNSADSPRWINHGRPPGGDVAAIAEVASIRSEVVFTISSIGELYEYDRSSKPSWKKHIWREGTKEDASLIPATGCTIHDLTDSISLFLLTKSGKLVERRLSKRKWKWISHGSPKDHDLTSITPVIQDELNEKFQSLLFTSSIGTVFEYRILKHSGIGLDNDISEDWLNHMHPPHAKAARGIPGLQLQFGRIIFPLNDGRFAELHLPGLGGEDVGPNAQISFRRKGTVKYTWSTLDAPETEGWNAEYCKEERGPMNCITGIKDEPNESGIARSTTRRRKGSHQDYIFVDAISPINPSEEEYRMTDDWTKTNFRLRVMHGGRSFFLITDGGLVFEYLYTENVWFWLRHDHSTPIKGALGNYNGSLYLVDVNGNLLARQRSGNELAWVSCTAIKKARQVIGGPPWDGIPGKALKATPEDSLFFVSKTGRLLQFTVALRKFKWKDCRNPPNTKVASILDQELFRENIVFVIGRNGRLYQYNKVTELWHEHYQSQHLVLSRSPGTAMRSPQSLTGSLFMLSEDGGLVEYHWNTGDGWNWVEHGSPNTGVTLMTSPSPCFDGNQLFLIGSNGKVYMRYMEQLTWKWRNCGFPNVGQAEDEDQQDDRNEEVCMDQEFAASLEKDAESFNVNGNCNPKVASTRPIPFSDDSIIFELRDGRLAEMRRVEHTLWVWSRIIGTPTSLCIANFWAAVAA